MAQGPELGPGAAAAEEQEQEAAPEREEVLGPAWGPAWEAS